jgi:hypothetical protein
MGARRSEAGERRRDAAADRRENPQGMKALACPHGKVPDGTLDKLDVVLPSGSGNVDTLE